MVDGLHHYRGLAASRNSVKQSRLRLAAVGKALERFKRRLLLFVEDYGRRVLVVAIVVLGAHERKSTVHLSLDLLKHALVTECLKLSRFQIAVREYLLFADLLKTAGDKILERAEMRL